MGDATRWINRDTGLRGIFLDKTHGIQQFFDLLYSE